MSEPIEFALGALGARFAAPPALWPKEAAGCERSRLDQGMGLRDPCVARRIESCLQLLSEATPSGE